LSLLSQCVDIYFAGVVCLSVISDFRLILLELLKWLQLQADCQTCPVCKSAISRDKLIPVYGRGKEQKDPRLKGEQIPVRPSGQRTEPVPPYQTGYGYYPGATPFTQIGNFSFSADFAIFPSLLGLQFQTFPHTERPEELNAEQRQATFSKLLFFLGAFIVICLVLFN